MANLKISELTADTAPTADDLVVTVNDPGGTPATKKATITNFTKAIPAVVGDAGAGGTKGLVPAPAAGDAAANKFLHADGTFKAPAGSGAIGGSTGATDNAVIRADGTGGATVQSSAISVDDNGAVTVPEIAAPSTPAAGKVVLYAKSDGLLYSKDDAGTETVVTGGGGGSAPSLPYAILPWMADSTANSGIGTNNQVRVARFALPFDITVNSIHFRVAGGSAATFGAVGIYDSAGTTLLIDSGPVSAATNGVKTTAIGGVTLTAGTIYLFAWTASSTVPVFSAINSSVALQEMVNGGTSNIFSAANASVAGQLPSSLGTLTLLAASANQIFIAKVQN